MVAHPDNGQCLSFFLRGLALLLASQPVAMQHLTHSITSAVRSLFHLHYFRSFSCHSAFSATILPFLPRCNACYTLRLSLTPSPFQQPWNFNPTQVHSTMDIHSPLYSEHKARDLIRILVPRGRLPCCGCNAPSLLE